MNFTRSFCAARAFAYWQSLQQPRTKKRRPRLPRLAMRPTTRRQCAGSAPPPAWFARRAPARSPAAPLPTGLPLADLCRAIRHRRPVRPLRTANSDAAGSQPGLRPLMARLPRHGNLCARVTKGPGTLPNDAGQEWREYDISPYTLRVTTTNRPEQAIVDWILRETGHEAWHGEPLGTADRQSPHAPRVSHARNACLGGRHRRPVCQQRGRDASLRHPRDHAQQPQLAGQGARDAAQRAGAKPRGPGLAAGQGRRVAAAGRSAHAAAIFASTARPICWCTTASRPWSRCMRPRNYVRNVTLNAQRLARASCPSRPKSTKATAWSSIRCCRWTASRSTRC